MRISVPTDLTKRESPALLREGERPGVRGFGSIALQSALELPPPAPRDDGIQMKSSPPDLPGPESGAS